MAEGAHSCKQQVMQSVAHPLSVSMKMVGERCLFLSVEMADEAGKHPSSKLHEARRTTHACVSEK